MDLADRPRDLQEDLKSPGSYQRWPAMCPLGSYGRRNRQAIAARETRITTRLRAIGHAYRTAIEYDGALKPPEAAAAPPSPEPAADKEIELE